MPFYLLICLITGLTFSSQAMQKRRTLPDEENKSERPAKKAKADTGAEQKATGEFKATAEAKTLSAPEQQLFAAIEMGGEEGLQKVQDLVKNTFIYPYMLNVKNAAGDTPLFLAINSGEEDIATFLIKHGGSSHAETAEGGITPLMAAATQSQINIVNLLGPYSNFNAQDKDGNTALMRAAKIGNGDIVLTLLQWEADASLKNNKGKKAVDLVPNDHQELVPLINKWENSRALIKAVENNDQKTVNFLLTQDIDVNIRTTDFAASTPLMLAVSKGYEGNIAIVKMLLTAKADTTLTNGAGRTALDIAQNTYNSDGDHISQEMVELLKR